jgi:hypothetical protein
MNDSPLNINDSSICFNDTFCLTTTYFDLKNLQPTYTIVLLTNTTLAIIITFFVTFIIWKKSTAEMRAYKWSILNIIWTSLCLELLLCIWMPVPLFPILGGYNGGIMQSANLEVRQRFDF